MGEEIQKKQYPKCLEVGKPILCYFEVDGRCLYAGICEHREGSENLRMELAKKRETLVEKVKVRKSNVEDPNGQDNTADAGFVDLRAKLRGAHKD